MKSTKVILWSGAVIVAALVASHCAPSAPAVRKAASGASDLAVAAQKVYVAPGDLDEYYMFASGGH